MYYHVQLQEHAGSWVYQLTFGRETPKGMEEVAEYADSNVSAEDPSGIRHYVLSKDGKIVQIQFHEAERIMPDLDPEHPELIGLPALQAIMFGNPPVPTLLVTFKEYNPPERTAYGLSPNVYTMFDGAELALMYVTDVYNVIPDVD